ncbi:hypothetical protein [Paenibacillus tengchongensis]|uniref:hypothetical protein n=1 Tax=Paenibacillus tengchongensis TaxID=2608684 RepID=UPI00124C49FD|nr:hypothetical protein [Paenibacillus tengchongensis]
MAIGNNFINTNEVYPIIDLIRREMQKQGLYTGNGSDLSVIDRILPDPSVVSVNALRELPAYPALVTRMIYTYDNGTIEKLTLERDDNLIVEGFLIEIEQRTLVNEQMEAESGITAFSTVHGTIIREDGLFKNLELNYTRAV